MDIPKPDLTIEAIGKQWYWTYAYPGSKFQFDSLMLNDADAAKAGEPRLLGVDNPIVVPVNKVIEIETTGADVIHSWAVPAFGVKMDAVPGRINHTWFKADQDRHLLRAMLRTVRRAPRLHADRGEGGLARPITRSGWRPPRRNSPPTTSRSQDDTRVAALTK